MTDSAYRHMLFAADYDAAREPGLLGKVRALRAALGVELLSLVHVVDTRGLHSGSGAPVILPRQHGDPVAEASTNITTTAMLIPQVRTALTDGADAFLGDLAQQLDVPMARCHAVEHDSVGEAIVGVAQKIGADLIVLGRGGGHWSSWFSAGIARGVLGHAPCDVLVVHLHDPPLR